MDFEKLDERQRRLLDTSFFLGKMVLAGIVLRTVIFLDPDTYFLQEFLASLTKDSLNMFGLQIRQQGALLIGKDSYLVTRDCLGWKSIAAYSSLIFASTKKPLSHGKTLLYGTSVILGVNFLRVTTTVALSDIGLISFDIIHSFLWRWGLTLTVLILWLAWLKQRDEQPRLK